jgi:hypothetical protein
MNGLTEKLYRALCALPQAEVSSQGARFIREIHLRAPEIYAEESPAVRTGRMDVEGLGSAERIAFDNAFRFAERHCRPGSRDETAAEFACLAAPAFAATALAQARGADSGILFHAVGLGMEAYTRLARSLEKGARAKGFDARVISAGLAAIAACAFVERLSPHQAAQAMGLGSSAVTGNGAGYLPLQIATAARDGIAMILLVACGFRGPPDPLACRWGVYEVFADAADIDSLAVDSHRMRVVEDCAFLGSQHRVPY